LKYFDIRAKVFAGSTRASEENKKQKKKQKTKNKKQKNKKKQARLLK
jgi:hypothetical protein